MAVNITLAPSKLRIRFSDGMDGKGKEIIKSKTYGDVKADALDEDVYAVADLLINLQDRTALEVGRIDEKEIAQA